MAISNAWRFGLPGSTYIDLPEPQIGGHSMSVDAAM